MIHPLAGFAWGIDLCFAYENNTARLGSAYAGISLVAGGVHCGRGGLRQYWRQCNAVACLFWLLRFNTHRLSGALGFCGRPAFEV